MGRRNALSRATDVSAQALANGAETTARCNLCLRDFRYQAAGDMSIAVLLQLDRQRSAKRSE